MDGEKNWRQSHTHTLIWTHLNLFIETYTFVYAMLRSNQTWVAKGIIHTIQQTSTILHWSRYKTSMLGRTISSVPWISFCWFFFILVRENRRTEPNEMKTQTGNIVSKHTIITHALTHSNNFIKLNHQFQTLIDCCCFLLTNMLLNFNIPLYLIFIQ